jgi:hypothetical protein
MLAEAEIEAAEIVATGEKFRSETIDASKANKAEADRIIAAAKSEIEQEVARAKEQLRNSVADPAVAGASKNPAARGGRGADCSLRSGRNCRRKRDGRPTIARPYAEAAFGSHATKRAAGMVGDAALSAAIVGDARVAARSTIRGLSATRRWCCRSPATDCRTTAAASARADRSRSGFAVTASRFCSTY